MAMEARRLETREWEVRGMEARLGGHVSEAREWEKGNGDQGNRGKDNRG